MMKKFLLNILFVAIVLICIILCIDWYKNENKFNEVKNYLIENGYTSKEKSNNAFDFETKDNYRIGGFNKEVDIYYLNDEDAIVITLQNSEWLPHEVTTKWEIKWYKDDTADLTRYFFNSLWNSNETDIIEIKKDKTFIPYYLENGKIKTDNELSEYIKSDLSMIYWIYLELDRHGIDLKYQRFLFF